jgi:hypothetical protein
MYNDSVETLLLRHYGQNGPTPNALEQRLINSLRQDTMTQQQKVHPDVQTFGHRMSRRRAMKLVAVGSAGLGLLGASLGALDTALFGGDATHATQSALS